jgi:ketosteroid isomerase-like protein
MSSEFLDRLSGAVNAHDLDGVVACFHDDYRNDTPAHPGRGFVGAEQVRKNWTMIFGGLPDMKSTIVSHVVDGDTVWSEWEMAGTRPDGVASMMRGVVVFGIRDGRAAWARFYLEPVDAGDGGVDAAVAKVVAS